MENSSVSTYEFEILGQRWSIRTDVSEEEFFQLVDHLRQKIEEVKKGLKVDSKLNILLLVALEMTHRYLKVKKRLEETQEMIKDRSNELVWKIDREIEERGNGGLYDKEVIRQ